MGCDHVVVTKKQHGIEILFDDLSEHPFVLIIAHKQNDRAITEGDCLFSVYVKMGEKYQLSCECIVEHGNTGKKNAAKYDEDATSHINIRLPPSLKARFVKQKERDGEIKLTAWILNTLTNALDHDLN